MSNGPWPAKQKALNEHSVLLLTSRLVAQNPDYHWLRTSLNEMLREAILSDELPLSRIPALEGAPSGLGRLSGGSNQLAWPVGACRAAYVARSERLIMTLTGHSLRAKPLTRSFHPSKADRCHGRSTPCRPVDVSPYTAVSARRKA